jgi:hypothetical protein
MAAQIDDSLSEKDKAFLLSASKRDVGLTMDTLGASVRTSFHLWQDNEQTRYFRSLGVNHPDMMSGVIVYGYIAYLQGRSVDLRTVAQEMALPPPPPEPPGYQSHGR